MFVKGGYVTLWCILPPTTLIYPGELICLLTHLSPKTFSAHDQLSDMILVYNENVGNQNLSAEVWGPEAIFKKNDAKSCILAPNLLQEKLINILINTFDFTTQKKSEFQFKS
jgi:hypothetical protein